MFKVGGRVHLGSGKGHQPLRRWPWTRPHCLTSATSEAHHSRAASLRAAQAGNAPDLTAADIARPKQPRLKEEARKQKRRSPSQERRRLEQQQRLEQEQQLLQQRQLERLHESESIEAHEAQQALQGTAPLRTTSAEQNSTAASQQQPRMPQQQQQQNSRWLQRKPPSLGAATGLPWQQPAVAAAHQQLHPSQQSNWKQKQVAPKLQQHTKSPSVPATAQLQQHTAVTAQQHQEQDLLGDDAHGQHQEPPQQRESSKRGQRQQQQAEHQWRHFDQEHYEQAAHNLGDAPQQSRQHVPIFRASSITSQSDLTSAIIVTLRRKKRLSFYAAGAPCIHKALKCLAFASPYLNMPQLGLDVVFQVNMTGHPLNPRTINSKVTLAAFSMQYLDGIDTLFANRGLEPYFVNKRNDVEKVAKVVMAMILNNGSVVLQSSGAEGVTQMLKAVAFARRRLLPHNNDITCLVRAYSVELPPSELFPDGSLQIRLVLLVVRCLPFRPLCWAIKPVVADSAADSSLAGDGASWQERARNGRVLLVAPDEAAVQGYGPGGKVKLEELARQQVQQLVEDNAAREAAQEARTAGTADKGDPWPKGGH